MMWIVVWDFRNCTRIPRQFYRDLKYIMANGCAKWVQKSVVVCTDDIWRDIASLAAGYGADVRVYKCIEEMFIEG